MTLWRVDVGDISHRFVDAGSGEEAVKLVESSILAALHLEATRASATLQQTYDASGPIKRRRLIAGLDGLTKPGQVQEAAAAITRLERLLKAEESRKSWIRDQDAKAPPIPHPDRIGRLLKQAEVDHVEHGLSRLRESEQQSDLHG